MAIHESNNSNNAINDAALPQMVDCGSETAEELQLASAEAAAAVVTHAPVAS
jgi:hypothetical protein